MNRTEMIMRRRNAQAFREADEVSVQFRRKGESVRTSVGGRIPGEVAILAPQDVRIVKNRRRYNNGLTISEAGLIPNTDYLLLADHKLDIKVDDEFQWRDIWYRVTGIDPTRAESIMASIDLLGGNNQREAPSPAEDGEPIVS